MGYVLTEKHAKILRRVTKFIVKDITKHYPIGVLSEKFEINEFALKCGFRQLNGVAIFEFLTIKRLTQAKKLLAQSELPVSDIAARCGYLHTTNLGAAFKRKYGMKPSEFRASKQEKAPMKRLHVLTVAEIRNFILKDLAAHHTISDLAMRFGLNEFELKTGFRKLYGIGPYRYLQLERLKLAASLLTTTNTNIGQIANTCGYIFPTNLTAAFQRYFHQTPEMIRNSGQIPDFDRMKKYKLTGRKGLQDKENTKFTIYNSIC